MNESIKSSYVTVGDVITYTKDGVIAQSKVVSMSLKSSVPVEISVVTMLYLENGHSVDPHENHIEWAETQPDIFKLCVTIKNLLQETSDKLDKILKEDE